MPLRAPKPYDNKGSRQRLVRIPEEIDDWLITLSRNAKAQDPESRSGVATQINAFIKAAYDKAHPRRKA